MTVVVATVATACFAPLVFLGGAPLVVVGVIVWGLGMAAQESIVKAAITGMVDPRRRAWAYGVFDTGFGICWFAGSIALGALYDRSVIEIGDLLRSCAVGRAAVPGGRGTNDARAA